MKADNFRAIKIFTLPLFLLMALLTGCATQMAPRYDEALYKGITQSNIEIMTLFASLSSGTEKNTFVTREARYNTLIGTVEALAIQSRARPMPESAITEQVNIYLKNRNIGPLQHNEAPSTNALHQIAKQLVKMKEVDKKSGLKAALVPIFKNAVVISLDQAITYESFLNR
ncbi:MAG: hypothetical protein HRU20_17775 [Pseudomonadales bacterium]|nr:hypothetical protein [Pseudomonadales bacterium]